MGFQHRRALTAPLARLSLRERFWSLRDQRASLAFLSLSISLLWSVPVMAWEPLRNAEGTTLHWSSIEEVEICAFGGVEDGAVRAWEGAAIWWTQGGLRAPLEIEASSCPLHPQDGRVSLVSISEEAEWPTRYGPSDLVVALTVHTYGAESGLIFDADIIVNQTHFQFGDDPDERSFDIGYVIAHEVGHALGIGHPCGDPGSTYPSCSELDEDTLIEMSESLMYPRRAIGPRGFDLSADDLEALDQITPKTGAAPEVPLFHDDDGWLILDNPDSFSEWSLVRPGQSAQWHSTNTALTAHEGALLLARTPQGGTHASILSFESPKPDDDGSGCQAMIQTPRSSPAWFVFASLLSLFLHFRRRRC